MIACDIEANVEVVTSEQPKTLSEKIRQGFIVAFISGVSGMALGALIADSIYPGLEGGSAIKTRIALAGCLLSFVVASLASYCGFQCPPCQTKGTKNFLNAFTVENENLSNLQMPLLRQGWNGVERPDLISIDSALSAFSVSANLQDTQSPLVGVVSNYQAPRGHIEC